MTHDEALALAYAMHRPHTIIAAYVIGRGYCKFFSLSNTPKKFWELLP